MLMTIGLTANQIEDLMISKLRGHPDCLAIDRVIVTPQGASGGWTARAVTKSGITIGYACARATSALVDDLRREYHLDG
jgi:hypothetical protein